MIRFACPGCPSTFTVGVEKAGKTGKCPKCQAQFVIPDAPAPPSQPAPVSRPPALPPPPPPAADEPSDTVEVAPCPKCGSRLSVLPSDLGGDIECPNCQNVYRATRADAPPPPETGSKSGSTSTLVKLGSGSDKDDDEEDDRSSKRKRRSRRDDDDDEEEEEEDDRPRRKKRKRPRSRGSYMEHRGDLLLILSLVGLFFFRILCIVVWVLANSDLKEMDAGRMDPEGRSKTNTARIIGMIGTILLIVALVVSVVFFCIWLCVVFAIFGAAGSGAVR